MINEDLALIYGTMLGDGCLSKVGKASFISISGNLHSDIPFFDVIIPILVKLRGKNVKAHKRDKYGKVEINFSDKKLFKKINNLGFPVGKKGTSLSIPEIFLPKMKQVVQGYFATDGCLVITNNNGTIYPRIEFSSISQELLQQVRNYLKTLDIIGNVYVSHKANFRSNKPLYRLQINGKKNLIMFKKFVGFVNPKHEEKFNYFSDNFINKQ